MIGNLILALGLACLSASALSTENFTKNIDINYSPYTSVGVSIYQNTITYGYDSQLDVNTYTVFDCEYVFDIDSYAEGDTALVLIKDGLSTFDTVEDINLDYSTIYGHIQQGYKYGIAIYQPESGNIYLEFIISLQRQSYVNSDNETFNFYNDSFKFKVDNGMDSNQNYHALNKDIDNIRYADGSYQLFYNRYQYYNLSTSMVSANGNNMIIVPFTLDCNTTTNNPLKVRFVCLHQESNLTFSQGYSEGYSNGFKDGESSGWQNGYIAGVNTVTGSNADVKNLFGVLADTPIRFLKDMFNFELFGMNVAVVILSCLSAIVVFALIKKIWK